MFHYKKNFAMLVAFIFLITGVVGCGQEKKEGSAEDKKTIKYGKAAGPYTVLFEDAVIPILEKKGYQFECVEFSDLLQNDMALNEGEIDMNVEQHTAFMTHFNQDQNGKLMAVTPIPTVPAGIFSAKHKTLDEIKKHSKVAISNDVSSVSRAYRVLQKAGWVKFADDADLSSVTDKDVVEDLYELEVTEMDSLNIPRSLDEVDYAVIPGSAVYNAGIDPFSVLLQEDIAPYLWLQVVINEKEKDSQWVKDVVEVYQSDEFKEYMEKNNNGLWQLPNIE